MTAEITHPPFVLYVVWHPEYTAGANIANRLHKHFGTDYHNITCEEGIPVLFRNTNAPNSNSPLRIDMNSAGSIAVVVLINHTLKNDPSWVQYFHRLMDNATTTGLNTRVFPVTLESDTHDICKNIHALRWDKCTDKNIELEQWLIIELTTSFIRMLRHCLRQILSSDQSDSLRYYMENLKIFLSHSKHDCDGKTVARTIRNWLHENAQLSSFFDVNDVIPGIPFDDVMRQSIKEDGVLLIIYTDSYSSRYWCRREIIEAKSKNVPVLMVDCLQNVDKRSFPYFGNVPVVRMNSDDSTRIPLVIEKLLDEVFNDLLWRYTVKKLYNYSSHTTFISRPPELISLATLPSPADDEIQLIVYPDPPLNNTELELFLKTGINIKLLNLKKWQMEIQNDR